MQNVLNVVKQQVIFLPHWFIIREPIFSVEYNSLLHCHWYWNQKQWNNIVKEPILTRLCSKYNSGIYPAKQILFWFFFIFFFSCFAIHFSIFCFLFVLLRWIWLAWISVTDKKYVSSYPFYFNTYWGMRHFISIAFVYPTFTKTFFWNSHWFLTCGG